MLLRHLWGDLLTFVEGLDQHDTTLARLKSRGKGRLAVDRFGPGVDGIGGPPVSSARISPAHGNDAAFARLTIKYNDGKIAHHPKADLAIIVAAVARGGAERLAEIDDLRPGGHGCEFSAHRYSLNGTRTA